MSNPSSSDRFDELAKDWDTAPQHIERTRDIAALIRERIPLKGLSALEVGAGTGQLSFALADSLKHVVAADPSQTMMDVLEQKIATSGIQNIQALVAGDDMEGVKGPFDLIFLQMTLHHIPDIAAFLIRAHQHLKPGGWIAIADLDTEDGSFHGSEITDVHLGFDRSVLVDQLAAAGFEPVSVGTAHTMSKPLGGTTRDYPIFLAIARAKP